MRHLQADGGLHPGVPLERARAGETHRALQDTNDAFLANLQKDGTYSVVPRIREITPEGLITIGEVARKYSLYTKITGGQRIDLFGARVDQLPAIWGELVAAGFETGQAYGKSVRTVKSCVGSTWCRYGVQDSMTLTQTLEHRYKGLRAPQAEVCGLRLHPGVRRGPEQGHRRHRHRAGLEPLCVRQRRHAAAPRRPVRHGSRRADPDPLHRPAADVLCAHRGQAATHLGLDGEHGRGSTISDR